MAVSAERAIDAIARLNAMGSPSAAVYTAGFSETGDGALERRLVEAAGDMAVVGPNCMGVVNYLDGVPVALTPDLGTERPEHGVALVAQSGTMIGNMVNSGRSLPVSHLFSMGNQAVTEIADAIDVLADDARVDAILLYVEGLRDAGAFARAAARAFDRGKTIVAMKAGASETGRDVAMSHTGSLAGPPELYDALFDRLGIVKVETFPELLEMSKLFAFDGAPRGNRLMVETCSGTDSGYCADLAERHGVVLPKLDGEAREAVERVIPAIATPANPLDVTMEQWGDREAQATSLIALLRQPSDAAALVINLPPARRDLQLRPGDRGHAGREGRHGPSLLRHHESPGRRAGTGPQAAVRARRHTPARHGGRDVLHRQGRALRRRARKAAGRGRAGRPAPERPARRARRRCSTKRRARRASGPAASPFRPRSSAAVPAKRSRRRSAWGIRWS